MLSQLLQCIQLLWLFFFLKRFFDDLTLDIIGEVAFGIDVDAQGTVEKPLLKALKQIGNQPEFFKFLGKFGLLHNLSCSFLKYVCIFQVCILFLNDN